MAETSTARNARMTRIYAIAIFTRHMLTQYSEPNWPKLRHLLEILERRVNAGSLPPGGRYVNDVLTVKHAETARRTVHEDLVFM